MSSSLPGSNRIRAVPATEIEKPFTAQISRKTENSSCLDSLGKRTEIAFPPTRVLSRFDQIWTRSFDLGALPLWL